MILSSEPEDTLATYLLESYFALPSPEWVMRYDSTNIAFQTLQGSLDDEHWYLRYDAKFELAISDGLGLRYSYQRLADYGDSIERHRIEPKLWISKHLNLGLMIVPTFTKRSVQLGFGCGWFSDLLNRLEVFLIIDDFANNEAVHHLPPGPEKEVYTRQPLRFEFDLSKEFSKGRMKLEWSWLPGSIKEVRDPDAPLTIKRQSLRLQGRIEGRPIQPLWLGLSYRYDARFEEARSPTGSSTDELKDLKLIPFLLLQFSDFWGAEISYLYTYKEHNSYTRIWDGPVMLVQRTLNPYLLLRLGYGSSERKRWDEGGKIPDPNQHRLILAGELFPDHRVSFVIKEGLDLDNLSGFKAALAQGDISYGLRILHERAFFGLLAQL
jgi:hypothetical protein